MRAARPIKYLPSVDFKEPRGATAVHAKKVVLTFSEAELAQAREDSYAEGRADGLATARGEIVADIATIEGRLAETMSAIACGLTENGETLKVGAAKLGLAVGKTLASALMRKTPLAEIERIVTECFDELREEPRVVIHANSDRMDDLRERIEEIAEQSAFPVKLIFIDDMEMAETDIRIEWAYGGASWEAERLQVAVTTAVERYIATYGEDQN